MSHMLKILTFFKCSLILFVSISLSIIITYKAHAVEPGPNDPPRPPSIKNITSEEDHISRRSSTDEPLGFECDDHEYPIKEGGISSDKPALLNTAHKQEQLVKLPEKLIATLPSGGMPYTPYTLFYPTSDDEDYLTQSMTPSTSALNPMQLFIEESAKLTSPEEEERYKEQNRLFDKQKNSWEEEMARLDKAEERSKKDTDLFLYDLRHPIDHALDPIFSFRSALSLPDLTTNLRLSSAQGALSLPDLSNDEQYSTNSTPLDSPVWEDFSLTPDPSISPHGQGLLDSDKQNQNESVDDDPGFEEGSEQNPSITVVPPTPTPALPAKAKLTIELLPRESANNSLRRDSTTSTQGHSNVNPLSTSYTDSVDSGQTPAEDSGYIGLEDQELDDYSGRVSPISGLEDPISEDFPLLEDNNYFAAIAAQLDGDSTGMIAPEPDNIDPSLLRRKRHVSAPTSIPLPAPGAAEELPPPTLLVIEPAAEELLPPTSLVVEPAAEELPPPTSLVVEPAAREELPPPTLLVIEPAAEEELLPSTFYLTNSSPSDTRSTSTSYLTIAEPGAGGDTSPPPAGSLPPPPYLSPKIIPNYYFTDIINIIRFFINNRFTGFPAFPNQTILAAGEENIDIQRGIWVSGLYGFIKQGLVDNIAGYTGHNRGGNIGFDVEINNHLIGITYSNIHSLFKFKTNKVTDRGIATSHVFSIYGQKTLAHNFTLQGLALVSRSYVNNINPYLFHNTQYNLIEKYRVTNYSLEALLNYHYLSKDNLILAPNIGLRYGFSLYDIHNNLSNLLNNSKSRNMLTGIIGTKLTLPLKKFSDSIMLGLTLQGGIEYNFNPKTQRITSTINIQNRHQIQNYILPKPPKTTYNIGVSLFTHIKNIQISLEYHYHLYKRYYSHHGVMKFKVNF